MTLPSEYGIVKIMERDFWSRVCLLGHMTLLVSPQRILNMTKEKKTFAWDTVLTMSLTSDKTTVRGTNIEVVWCPITKMYWEK